MNDTELMFASKAAGMAGDGAGGHYDELRKEFWTPREDDGQAFRLLASIGNRITGDQLLTVGDAVATQNARLLRYSIVNVAAEIGKEAP